MGEWVREFWVSDIVYMLIFTISKTKVWPKSGLIEFWKKISWFVVCTSLHSIRKELAHSFLTTVSSFVFIFFPHEHDVDSCTGCNNFQVSYILRFNICRVFKPLCLAWVMFHTRQDVKKEHQITKYSFY